MVVVLSYTGGMLLEKNSRGNYIVFVFANRIKSFLII